MEVAEKVRKCKDLNKEVMFGYCRQGRAKNAIATALCDGAATRAIDNQIIFVTVEVIKKW